jgi:hypothetical protein
MPYARPAESSQPGLLPFAVTSRRVHIGAGERGNFTFISEARSAINGPDGSSNFLVRQTAIDVTMGVEHDDAEGLVAALKGYLATIPFIPDDYGNQNLYKPKLSILLHAIHRQRISCASIAVLGAALARSIGLQPAFMVLAFEGGPPIFSHIYAVARDPEGGPEAPWRDLDATHRFQRGMRDAPVARWRMIPI